MTDRSGGEAHAATPPTARRAVPGDAASVGEVVDRAYAGYVGRIGRRPAPMDEDHAAVLAEAPAWVVEDAGRVVAVLVARVRADHLLVENVAVDPTVQGRGLGSLLLDVAEGHARALGLPEVRLYTNEAMTENLAFYPRRGYREVGRAEQDGFRRVFFVKPLPAR